jgi:hypothetical protein
MPVYSNDKKVNNENTFICLERVKEWRRNRE